MGQLLTIQYWFNIRPGSLTPFGLRAMVIFIGILVVLAIVSYIMKSKKSGAYYKIWLRFNGFFIGNAIIGIFLFLFMYEEIPVLAGRYLSLAWYIGMAFWMSFIIKLIMKIPEMKQKKAEEHEYKKYIP